MGPEASADFQSSPGDPKVWPELRTTELEGKLGIEKQRITVIDQEEWKFLDSYFLSIIFCLQPQCVFFIAFITIYN